MIKLPSTNRGRKDKPTTFTTHITVNLTGSTAHEKENSSISTTSPKDRAAQEFAFINSTAPGRHRDPEIRRLVRGHVVRDFIRKKNLEQRQPQRQRQTSSETSQGQSQGQRKATPRNSSDSTESVSLSPEQSSLAISQKHLQAPTPTQGLDPNPHISRDLYRITALGEAMYPLTSSFRLNPISPAAWFDCALKDEALFHALLYITCTYSNLVAGSSSSSRSSSSSGSDGDNEAMAHAGKSVTLVKRKLEVIVSSNNGGGGDGRGAGKKKKKPAFEYVENMVRTVSCLAITEAIKGNSEGWKIHMMGLKQLVGLRGGLVVFGTSVQLKLHRADLLGAVDFLEEPFFGRDNFLMEIPSRYELENGKEKEEEKGGNREEMKLLLNTLPISEEMLDTLAYMHGLSNVVSRILGSSTVCSGTQQVSWQKHAYALRYSLLGGLGKCDSRDEERRVLDEALRIGAFLYVQATPQEFPYSVVGPANLVAKLKELVLTIQMWNEREGNLVMWLLFMGGISARKGEDKLWFVTQLEKLTTHLRLLEWEVVNKRLGTLWWVRAIHEKPCKKLWDEVITLRMVEVITTASQLST